MRYQQIVEYDGQKVSSVGYIPADEAEPRRNGSYPWRGADWLRLRPLVLGFLVEMSNANRSDITPSNNNADALIHLGILRAELGDPCYAMWKDGEIIGFTYWIGLNGVFPGIEMKEKICTALGTYILPEHRRQGVSVRLRNAAFKQAKKAGYARVDGSAHDKIGYESAKKVGAGARGFLISRRL